MHWVGMNAKDWYDEIEKNETEPVRGDVPSTVDAPCGVISRAIWQAHAEMHKHAGR
jgi:hypothetical protein